MSHERAALPDAVIDALWKRMGGFYGARWLDMWGETPVDQVKKVWAEELAHVTPLAMKHALDNLDGNYPPSLPEFRALCRKFRPRDSGIANVVMLTGPRKPVPDGTFKRLQDIIHAPQKREEGGS